MEGLFRNMKKSRNIILHKHIFSGKYDGVSDQRIYYKQSAFLPKISSYPSSSWKKKFKRPIKEGGYTQYVVIDKGTV